jgi:hypothetical protein
MRAVLFARATAATLVARLASNCRSHARLVPCRSACRMTATQPVRNVKDMPSCFSRPICQLAMLLNDEARGRDRQRLLPFVTRLACADSDEIEQQRQTYISSRMTRFMSLERGIEILEGALAIGRQADPIALPDVEKRMSVAKEEVSAATSKGENPLSATVQHLLYAMAL